MYETIINDHLFSSDKTKLQLDVIHNYLSKESYWAQNMPIELVKKSIEGSICFGVYLKDKQIGYARVVTDGATFGYLADVFILEAYRGKGLSKQLMQFIMAHPDLQGLRRMMLATKDAQGLYKQFGFTALAMPERIMEIKFFDKY
ncbi:MAG: GNAT family N-acetyltransferase [Bacteroidota bacterium]|nr:GNAT family N-acetyltransferase [Bacteroidota bacterium]